MTLLPALIDSGSRTPGCRSAVLRLLLLFGLVGGIAVRVVGDDGPAKSLPLPGEDFTVAGHQAFLIRPPVGTPATGGWVWYTPTLPSLPGPEERWMFERFLAAGLCIAGVDAGESYGSPDGNRVFDAFLAEVRANRGLLDRPVFLARSRGGLMALSWAAAHPSKVAGIAGIYPVCDLTSYPGLEKAAPAFHLEPSELARRLGEFNPVERLAPLAKARVPLYLLHGTVDTLVPLERNSGVVHIRYAALHGSVTLHVAPGQGHSMWNGYFECQRLVDFVILTAGERGR